MKDKKEVKRLMKFGRRILEKKVYKNLHYLKDKEKEEIIKHAIKVRLINNFEELNHKKNKMKEQGKEVFFIENNLDSLKSKIKLFTSTYHKSDFIMVNKLFKKIKKEIKND